MHSKDKKRVKVEIVPRLYNAPQCCCCEGIWTCKTTHVTRNEKCQTLHLLRQLADKNVRTLCSFGSLTNRR